MRTILIGAVLCALNLSGQNCRLEVRPVDIEGRTIDTGSFLIQNGVAEHPANKLVEVPCGRISFAVRSPGFETSQVLLNVLPGDNFVSVGLSIGKISGAPQSSFQTVSVRNWDKYTACDRLKIISPYRSELAYESKLSHRGRTSVRLERPGVFVFVLLSPDGVCGTAVRRLDSSVSGIDIDIEPIGQ